MRLNATDDRGSAGLDFPLTYGRSEKKINIKINNTSVEETDSTKYLGSFIDNKLTFVFKFQVSMYYSYTDP